MSKATESLYVAMRQKDLPRPQVDSIEATCLQCGDKVWIHIAMLPIMLKAKGVICMPCVQEFKAQSEEEIIGKNIDNTIKILDEEIGE
jgi:hypothetical protein